MKKKHVIWAIVGVIIIIMVVANPEGSADVVKTLGSWMINAAKGIGDFFVALAS